MELKINLRHLKQDDLHLLGKIPVEMLDLPAEDELVHTTLPLTCDLQAQLMDESVLVHGTLVMPLRCECARCLKEFAYEVRLDHWAVDLRLEGEDKVRIVDDCVDLTPYIREDILLAFPQHPLCEPDCPGLPVSPPGANKKSSGTSQSETSSAWAELNKLKFEKEP
jgi:uncharacterized protein